MTQAKNTQRNESLTPEQQQAIIRTREEVDTYFEQLSNQPKYSYTEANKEYTVSNHTAEWVRIYKAVQQLWGDISDIVYVESRDRVDTVMEERFVPHLSPLLDEILKGIADSVYESFGSADNSTML